MGNPDRDPPLDPGAGGRRVFGFAGYSGSGKTTLIEQLIPRFVLEGLRVSLIKHAHKGFDMDRPGKDSWRHREAGATQVLISSPVRWVLTHELRGSAEPGLDEQIAQLAPCDLVLVEGYKKHPIPKLEIHRAETGKPLLHPEDPYIVAVATDVRLETGLPQFALGDYDAIAAFIMNRVALRPRQGVGEGVAGG